MGEGRHDISSTGRMMPWPRPYPARARRPGPGRTNPMIQRAGRSRMFGWEPHPLRRRTDRAEGGVLAALIVVFLITAPLVVALAGHWARGTGVRQQRAEVAWRLVPALMERGVPAQRADFSWPSGTMWIRARWSAPDGQPRQGWIPVNSATMPGSARVWVSRTGSLTGPPLRPGQLGERIAVAEMLAASAVISMFFLFGWAGRCLINRQRLDDWEQAWRVIEPQWTRQR